MKQPAPLTLDAALAALRARGCGPTPTTPSYTCPRCPNGLLAITANGATPHFTCTNNCEGIAGYLEGVIGVPGGVPDGADVDHLAVVRDKLKLPELDRIVKHGRHGSAYNLHLNDGRIIVIGAITTLISQPKFRAAFLPQVRRSPPRHKTDEWDKLVDAIERAAEERDAVATQADETLSWISASLNTNKLRRNVNTDNSAEMFDLLASGTGGKPPFFDQTGRLHLRLEHMIEWLGGRAGIKVTQPELSARLSELDFERVQHAARSGDVVRKARYWVSPPGIEALM